MFGTNLGWRFIIYVALGLVISILILQFYMLPRSNARVCVGYFEDEDKCSNATKYSLREEICYCEDGNHHLDKDMIEVKNLRFKEEFEARRAFTNDPKIPEINISAYLVA